MKRSIVAFCLLCTFCGPSAQPSASAQPSVWKPSPGHTQMPIWPGGPPGGHRTTGPETVATTLSDHLVAGKPWTYISNVSWPTLTVYSPKGKNTGAAVIVFPGGGYRILAVDLEGTEVCDWLTSKGISCVLLKYRVPNAGPHWNQECGCDLDTRSSMPLEDAQRTISLVRAHAAEWHIDPHKIGVLGFSAGGHLVAMVSTHFDRRAYRAVDAADKESCRPDFAVALYPGHLFDYHKLELRSELHVTDKTPPTFLVHAENDNVDGVSHSLSYYEALKNAGVPVEMHLYAEGRHAFGLRRTKFPITAWPALVETWLQTIGVTPAVNGVSPQFKATPADRDEPLRVSGDSVIAPVAINKVDVDFKPCLDQKIEIGRPVVEAVIDQSGAPRNVHLLKPVPPCVEKQILAAVQHWRFRPGTHRGKPVSVIYNITFNVHYR